MPVKRIFHKEPLLVGKTVFLDEKEAHHVIHVLRIFEDEFLEVVNGQGDLAVAKVVSAKKKKVELLIEKVKREKKPELELVLALGMTRASHLDFAIEKCTELGCTKFILFPGDRGERSDVNISRVEALCVAAIKQSGRLFLPSIEVRKEIGQWPLSERINWYFGSLEGTPQACKAALIPEQSIGIVIGPESGFSGQEEMKLKELGAKPISFSKAILRAETAAIAACAIAASYQH